MTTHKTHADRQGLAMPCNAQHITFGGRCLNCGWQGPQYADIPFVVAERDRLREVNAELVKALGLAADAAYNEALNLECGKTVAQSVFHAVKNELRAALAKAGAK